MDHGVRGTSGGIWQLKCCLFFFSLFREREMVPNSVVVVFKFPVEREKAPNSVVLLFFNSREREMAPKSAACLMLCVI